MNVEYNRLRTFERWEGTEWTMSNQFDALAKAGFYATDRFLYVKCYFCGVEICIGNAVSNIAQKHSEACASCPFLLHPDRTDNVRIFDALELKREECRLATFVNWPVAHITPSALAKAGFYYTYNSDQVKCAWCEGIIGQWEIGDDPFVEHRKFFPNCAKVIANATMSNSTNSVTLDASIGIQPVKAPNAPQFSSLDSRMRSFETWTMGHIQDPERLAQAGFYYLGRTDEVHCFHCDGGLRFWLSDDDPWFEHARCFPKCQFVQLVKGQLFIENVQSQIKNHHHAAAPASHHQQQIQVESIAPPAARMSLEEALGTEPVRLALSMGLNAGRVRAITKRQLDTTGAPFSSSQALIEAVLDGQIQDEELDDDEPTASSSSSSRNRRIENEVSRLLWTAISSSTVSSGPNLSSFNPIVSAHSTSPPPQAQTLNPSSVAAAAIESPLAASPGGGGSASLKNVPELPLATSNEGDDKTLRLLEENKRLKEARECKICMTDEVGVVFCPCGHLVSCVQCAPAVSNCPVCRAVIKGRVRTFLS